MPFSSLRTATLPLALLATLAAVPALAQPEVVALVRRAGPAVVTLKTYSTAGRYTGLGSGFFLPDGRIVTNRHVVQGSGRIDIVDKDDRVLGNVQYAEAINGTADLAILPRSITPPATLRIASALPEAGEQVVVIGAPEGLSNTVSTGNVSAVRRMGGRTLVQISAPISHGSSGGPVLNMRGEVVGVSVSMLSEGQNLNFAVPSTELTTLSQTRPGHISFSGDLRGASGGVGGADISGQNLSRLPRIALGQTVTGRLDRSDFVRPDGSYADSYVYTARAGERVTVVLRSNDFDSWLVVDDPTGPMQEHDDDSGGNLDSELTVTFPHAGQYLIVANSVAGDATGSYRMTLSSGGSSSGGDRGDSGTGGVTSTGEEFDVQNATPISLGQTVSGRLTTSDTRRDDGSYADSYLYRGRAGERITVTLRSQAFDAWVVVDEPAGPFREHDDDSGGGNDAQLTVTLPRSGNYIILANSVAAGATGPYTLSLQGGGGGGGSSSGVMGGSQPGGTGTIADLGRRSLPRLGSGQSVSGHFGPGSFVRSDDNTYAAGYRYSGRAGERVTISMSSGDFDSWLVFDDPNGPMQEHDDDSGGGNDSELTVTLPHDGDYVIVANQVSRATGDFNLSVRGGGGGGMVRENNGGGNRGGGSGGELSSLNLRTLPTIARGQTVSGRLTPNDFVRTDGSYADAYVYQGRAGERITVTLRSDDFDAWLVVDEPRGPFRETNDDDAGGTDARLTITLPRSGPYLIVANTLRSGATGRYTLTLGR